MATEVQPVVKDLSVVYLYVRDLERSVGFVRGGTRFALHAWHQGARTFVDPDGYELELFEPPR